MISFSESVLALGLPPRPRTRTLLSPPLFIFGNAPPWILSWPLALLDLRSLSLSLSLYLTYLSFFLSLYLLNLSIYLSIYFCAAPLPPDLFYHRCSLSSETHRHGPLYTRTWKELCFNKGLYDKLICLKLGFFPGSSPSLIFALSLSLSLYLSISLSLYLSIYLFIYLYIFAPPPSPPNFIIHVVVYHRKPTTMGYYKKNVVFDPSLGHRSKIHMKSTGNV